MNETLDATASANLGCERCRAVPASRADLALEQTRSLHSDCHEGFALYRCRQCGQIYLEQFHEIVDWVGGVDDLWQRWVPLTVDEVAEVERLCPTETEEYDEVPRLAALMHRRGRLTRDPLGRFRWSEHGWDAGDLLPPG
jgi:hypothetical protein